MEGDKQRFKYMVAIFATMCLMLLITSGLPYCLYFILFMLAVIPGYYLFNRDKIILGFLWIALVDLGFTLYESQLRAFLVSLFI
jgi:hypothetical protein